MALLLTSCAYRLGSPQKTLPGGYKQISIPMFKNLTQEPGIEVSFTNSIIQEFGRSRIARVVEPSQAEGLLEGEVTDLQYLSGGSTERSLPSGSVLATEYRILLFVRVRLKRQSDKTILWQSDFTGERTYVAPQVASAGINTVNPLYNLSARRQNIEVMASEIMAEAHDRLTENF